MTTDSAEPGTLSSRTLRIATQPISAVYTPPPDKSIAHRALFLGAISSGTTTIVNISRSVDVASTLGLVKRLGCAVELTEAGIVINPGRVVHEGTTIVDCGNSGTTARLAAGFLTGERGEYLLMGDLSLSSRPMERICEPLRLMGAEVWSTTGHLPISILSRRMISGMVEGEISVWSAQVHASLVLAALRSEHGARLRRTAPMRDHTRRLALHFGLEFTTEADDGHGTLDVVTPGVPDHDLVVDIPGDPSSAAFFAVAALLVPDSRLDIVDVSLNPTRHAFFDLLTSMGGDIRSVVLKGDYEPRGTLHCAGSPDLVAMEINGEDPAHRLGEMIDELPLLALVGSQARGRTVLRGAGELRLKESDRIAGTVRIMRSLGVVIEELPDGFVVEGPQRIVGGVTVDPEGDHRLAMLAAIAGTIAEGPVSVANPDIVAVSYPGFWEDLGVVVG